MQSNNRDFMLIEFRNWLVNDTQIVDIPTDLNKWFPPHKNSNISSLKKK